MCVSTAPARFSSTSVMVNAAKHPTTGKLIHVLAYQNAPEHLADANGNAMLLHFPTKKLGKDNIVDTSSFPHFLEDMIRAVKPEALLRRRGAITRDATPKVEIFDHDIYTIAVSSDAKAIANALKSVPEDRRPQVNKKLFKWYADNFPGWSFALCCFNNRDAMKAKPLLWWYEPIDPRKLMMPGIDAHTGEVPRMSEMVKMDHWVFAGMQAPKPGANTVEVTYRDPLPDFARAILPKYIIGEYQGGSAKNGDFIVDPTEMFPLRRGLLKAAA